MVKAVANPTNINRMFDPGAPILPSSPRAKQSPVARVDKPAQPAKVHQKPVPINKPRYVPNPNYQNTAFDLEHQKDFNRMLQDFKNRGGVLNPTPMQPLQKAIKAQNIQTKAMYDFAQKLLGEEQKQTPSPVAPNITSIERHKLNIENSKRNYLMRIKNDYIKKYGTQAYIDLVNNL